MGDYSRSAEKEKSTQNKKNKHQHVIGYRLSPKIVPMFEEIALQAFEAHLIHEPKLTELAKFSLSYFAEVWLRHRQAQAEQKAIGAQRSPLKDIEGNLYMGPGRI